MPPRLPPSLRAPTCTFGRFRSLVVFLFVALHQAASVKVFSAATASPAPADALPRSIMLRGNVAWKRLRWGLRFQTELGFYTAVRKMSPDNPLRKLQDMELLPRLIAGPSPVGVNCCFFGISNLAAGFSAPAVLDVRVGREQPVQRVTFWTRMEQEEWSCMFDGACVNGGWGVIDPVSGASIVLVGKTTSRSEQADALARFFVNAKLRREAAEKVRELKSWWLTQAETAFYGSSVIFAYDMANVSRKSRAAVVDFRRAQLIDSKDEDKSGFGQGLDSLLELIERVERRAAPPRQLASTAAAAASLLFLFTFAMGLSVLLRR